MKKDLLKRLKSYSLAASAVLSADAVKSTVVYTDVNPDQTFSLNGTYYNLDLNNDNTNDWKISVSKSTFSSTFFSFAFSRISVFPYGLNAVAASSSYYALAMATNDNISNGLPWATGFSSSGFVMAGKFSFYSSSWGSSTFSYGNWLGATNKYLGLRLRVGSNTYYGYARLDVNIANGSFTIKDYAYESASNTPILAGANPTADIAKNVIGVDVDENSNGSDLQVSFTKATNESTLSEYRIMVVKSVQAPSFNLASAQAVTIGNYTKVTPTGSNITTALAAGSRDTDGNAIAIGVPYKVFVLSKANGTTITIDGLSTASPAVTLNTTAPQVTGLTATDISNNLNSSDIEVSFLRPAGEAKISAYRIFVVKTVDASLFNLSAAQAVPSGKYAVVNPSGFNIKQPLPSTLTDINGNAIIQGTPYRIFVMSEANGSTSNIDNLSLQSNEIVLSPYTGVSEYDALDVQVYGSGKSVFVTTRNIGKNSSVRVIDNNGRIVYSASIRNNREEFTLDVSPGVYIVSVNIDGGISNQKLMID